MGELSPGGTKYVVGMTYFEKNGKKLALSHFWPLFVEKLPFTVDLNVWGDEIYSSKSPITQPEENAKNLVSLYDVAYWPTGKAICLFFGSTPIGNPGEITPASAVNVIGKIITTDKTILNDVDGNRAEFSLQ